MMPMISVTNLMTEARTMSKSTCEKIADRLSSIIVVLAGIIGLAFALGQAKSQLDDNTASIQILLSAARLNDEMKNNLVWYNNNNKKEMKQ